MLETVPDEVLSCALLSGSRFHCIKDLLFHIPDVEDGWINGDIRQIQMVQNTVPVLRNSEGGPFMPASRLTRYSTIGVLWNRARWPISLH
jgi:hypothetical protein